MTLRRSFVPISLAALLAACASVPTHRAPEPAREITFELPTAPIRTRDQLLAAFAAHGLPVASSQPGVIEFQAPRERGILGFDEVFARAIITPLECGTRVTLFGEETHYPNATARQGSATRIGPGSTGRREAPRSGLKACRGEPALLEPLGADGQRDQFLRRYALGFGLEIHDDAMAQYGDGHCIHIL